MQVPKFKRYDPSQDDMDRHQLSFYKLVESNLNKGNYVDVDGNISYVFVFLYKLLARWNEDGFDYLFEFLIYHQKYINMKRSYLFIVYIGLLTVFLDLRSMKSI